MILVDLPVNSEPISLKFCTGHFQVITTVRIILNISKVRPFDMYSNIHELL